MRARHTIFHTFKLLNCKEEVHQLQALKGNDANLMQHKRIVGSNRPRLVEKSLGKFGVVRKSILKANIEQWQVTSTSHYQLHSITQRSTTTTWLK